MDAFQEPASLWVTRFASMIVPGGNVLDLACGKGRNARWLAQHGWQVEAVDRDAEALAELRAHDGITTLQADLESAPWPYANRKFDAIIVCRYLHRPLLPVLASSLEDGGVLIYETFMQGQEQFGRPSNPEFLLLPDELLEVFSPMLEVVAFGQGREEVPVPSVMQRICARNTIK